MHWIPTVSQTLNTAIVLVLAFGLIKRHQTTVHVRVMLTAFVCDVANVLLIELHARTKGKGAVEQGVESLTGTDSPWIEQFHIITSTLCILGYVVAVYTGLRLRKRGRGRKAHKINACIFLVTRMASYVSSFWMGG